MSPARTGTRGPGPARCHERFSRNRQLSPPERAVHPVHAALPSLATVTGAVLEFVAPLSPVAVRVVAQVPAVEWVLLGLVELEPPPSLSEELSESCTVRPLIDELGLAVGV